MDKDVSDGKKNHNIANQSATENLVSKWQKLIGSWLPF